jgi:uncharacterized protein (TIGR02646 family)
LAEAATNFANGIPSTDARTAFDTMHKPALRSHLYVEQHHLCVFCEQEINDGSPMPRIDHWRPLSLNLFDVFNWDNLHLSCATLDTCDARKDCTPLKWLPADADLPWPAQFVYEDIVGFTSGGRIYVRGDVQMSDVMRLALQLAIDDQDDNGVRRKAILNLNAPPLRAAREAAIDDEEAALLSANGGEQPTQAQRHARATSILAAAHRPGFVSMRVAWLRQELGRGR